MTVKLIHVFRQLLAFVIRNFNLSKRYFEWEIVFLVYHIVGALAIGFLAKSMGSNGQDNLMLFLLIGSVMWVYLSSIFHEIGNQISYERWEGTIEFTFMAPVKRIIHLIGNSLFAVLYGIIKTVLVLIFVVLLFQIDMSNANVISAFVVLIISALSLIGLGMMASIIPLISPEKGAQALHIVEACLMLVSGIYYKVDVLPGWMQITSRISPATYSLEGMRLALIDGVGVSELFLTHVMPLFVMGVILIPIGLFVFKYAEQHAKKTGGLKRSG